MLKPGSQIGQYTIERELGRGGMGVVFLARDTRLDRAVAIKSLPEHLSSDPDRLARFQREAKLLASLNHSNIGAIYGLEEAESHRFLVLEFIEGETLADRLKRGPIAIDDVIPLAKQIAEALEAAHEKGVIHRDLKPGNVMVTPEGKIKVLDFGLARTADGNPSTSGFASIKGDSPTVVTPKPAHSPTIAGVVLGTAGYMSPEQARGKPVDKRSDIFSFGCVLFEMLSGAGPFPGENATDSMGAILHGEPPWALLPPNTPPNLLLLLRRCLAKDKHNRLHDIGDARIELDLVANDPHGTTIALATPQKRTGLPPLAIAALVALAGAGGWFAATRLLHAPAAPAQRPLAFSIPSATATYRSASDGTISPDGRRIVLPAMPSDGAERRLFLRSLDSFDAVEIPETVNASSAFWSPDSKFIGFFQDGKIWVTEAGGTGSRRLITAVPTVAGACWAPDGTIIFSPAEGGLRKVASTGGKSEPLTTSKPDQFEKGHLWPTMLPDGRRFFFIACTFNPNEEVQVRNLYVGSLDSPGINPVMPLNAAAWLVAPNTLVYSENGTIKARQIDPASLKPLGEPTTLADGVFTFSAFSFASMSVANDGTIIFNPPATGDQLVWFDTTGKRTGLFAQNTNIIDSFYFSPDGSRLVTAVRDPRSNLADIWIFGVDRNTRMRLTSNPGWESTPVWSSDASVVYFSSDKKGYPGIYSIKSDGSAPAEEVYVPSEGGLYTATDASRDGKSLVISGSPPGLLPSDVLLLPLDGSKKAKPFRSTPAQEFTGRYSPDGKWIAFCSDEAGVSHVFIAPADGSGQKIQVSNERGFDPLWSPAGDRLYFGAGRAVASSGTTPERIMAVDLTKPDHFKLPPAPTVILETTESISGYAVHPDGKRLLLQLTRPGTPDLRALRYWAMPATK
ncbi:MAG: protein kinase [Planctomycetes bacterium]|nr:protein kinase [Planctomycetota bacterium]